MKEPQKSIKKLILIKLLYTKLEEGHRDTFKLIYADGKEGLTTGQTVANLPWDKIDWAFTQVHNSIDNMRQ